MAQDHVHLASCCLFPIRIPLCLLFAHIVHPTCALYGLRIPCHPVCVSLNSCIPTGLCGKSCQDVFPCTPNLGTTSPKFAPQSPLPLPQSKIDSLRGESFTIDSWVVPFGSQVGPSHHWESCYSETPDMDELFGLCAVFAFESRLDSILGAWALPLAYCDKWVSLGDYLFPATLFWHVR
eukprot:3849815-Amphidinium_carterae.1